MANSTVWISEDSSRCSHSYYQCEKSGNKDANQFMDRGQQTDSAKRRKRPCSKQLSGKEWRNEQYGWHTASNAYASDHQRDAMSTTKSVTVEDHSNELEGLSSCQWIPFDIARTLDSVLSYEELFLVLIERYSWHRASQPLVAAGLLWLV